MQWRLPTGAREVRVEVQSGLHSGTSRWLLRISRQKTENVVAPSMPRLDHQAKIGRERPIVRRPRRLIILVRGGDIIAQLARAFFDLAFVVRFGVVFIFFGHGFHFVDGVGGADEGSPGNTAQGVAGGTDFAVDLETAAEAKEVVLLGEMQTWWLGDRHTLDDRMFC